MCGQSINWDGMLDSRQVFKNASAESEVICIFFPHLCPCIICCISFSTSSYHLMFVARSFCSSLIPQ